MKKIHIIMMVAAMVLVATFGCSKQKATIPEAEEQQEVGTVSALDTSTESPTNPSASHSDTTAVLPVDEFTAPDITLKDLGGKTVSLSSLRGKPVVLDFWGSWCVWCIRGFPKMKEYYQKYVGKFEIMGIDCNDTDEAWRKAVKDNDLPWLQVYCPEGSSVFDDYDIQGFPTKIILDTQGRVMKTFLGEDPAFYKYLDDILNNEH